MWYRATGLVLVLCILVPSAGFAQRTANHDGFWISFGLGGGWSLDEGFFGETRSGFASQLRMGGTPSQQVLVGGEAIGWTTTEGNTELTRGNAHFVVLYYPSARGGLYLKGGVGFAGRTTDVSALDTVTLSDEDAGLGLGAGLGYEIQLARNFFITPAADFVFQGISDDNASMLLLTLNALWH